MVRKALAAIDASDVLALVGVAAVEYGVSAWSGPAAWVVGGLLLIAVAMGPSLRGKGMR